VHDYFGERYRLIRHLDDTFDEVEVTCVPEAMAAWAMQCSEYVEVLSPQELRKDIRKKCQNLLEKYRDDTD
jgi:predicted DNA-binding transcriptional regulator YafY